MAARRSQRGPASRSWWSWATREGEPALGPYDLGYPFPLRRYRSGTLLGDVADGAFALVNSNDQHCYLRYPAGADIRIGDLFAFGISHPCTAFDKWDVLYRVDDEFNVIGALKTFF